MIDQPTTPLIDIETERILLGSIMQDPAPCFDILDEIEFTADMLVSHRHGLLYAAMLAIHQDNPPVDYIKVVHAIKGQVEDCAGVVRYLTDAMAESMGASSCRHCATVLKRLSRQRRIAEALDRFAERANKGEEDADALADETMQAMLAMSGNAPVRKTSSIGEVAKLVQADFDYRLEHGDMRGPSTGFPALDEMLKGLRGGENYIIAARPAMGKTQLALQIAENVALRGTPVAFFSLEMATLQLGDRFIGMRSAVPAKVMRNPREHAEPEDIQDVYAAVKAAKDIPFYIVDAVGMGIAAIRGEARRLHASKGVRAVFIDYLGLIARRDRLSTNDAVGENSRGVKALARELNIPVICLAQLNRQVETRDAKMPKLSDLRDSGEIEQDADAVMMIHRPDYYRQQENPNAPLDYQAFIGICKHRNGPTGNVQIGFDAGRFFNPNTIQGRY